MAGSKWHNQSGAVVTDSDGENLQLDRETGIVEKLLNTYGFIRCCDRQARLFFHYSQYNGNVEHLKVGDPVDFEMTFDKKSGKPIAVAVTKICSDISLTVGVGQQLVSGIVTSELNVDGKNGRVAYENCGECFFFEFNRKDLVDPIHDKPRQGQEVQFVITQDAAGNLQATEVRSVLSPSQGMQTPRKQAQPTQPQAVSQQQLQAQQQTQQQQFITAPIVYPGVMLPMMGSLSPVVTAFGSPIAVAPHHHQMAVATSRVLAGIGGPNGNGGRDTDIQAVPGGGVLQQKLNQTISQSSINGSSGNSLATQTQQQNPSSITSTNIQHFSGQTTKPQILSGPLEHQMGGPLQPPNHSGQTKGLNKPDTNNQQQQQQDTTNENLKQQRFQGVVCSLKDSYGFVERADVVKEIFFHCSEAFQGIAAGDDVSFDIAMRNNREVAVNLQRLPSGTVIFEDIENRVRRGTVTRLANQSEEPLDGRLIYEENGEKKEVGFGERDLAPLQWTMKEGDPVEFQLATDRRDGLQRATNIFFAVSSPGSFAKESRLTGTVVAIKDNYGFVTADDNNEFYFKLNEILDAELKVDTVVNFSLGSNDANAAGGNSPRQVAIRICKPPTQNTPNGKTKKGRKSAATPKYTNRGYVVALKEHFGFIEAENRQEDLFFHFTIVDGDVKDLQVGSEVEYGLVSKHQRPSADCVRAIDKGSIPGIEMISDEIYVGRITRTLRCFNPDQVPYTGIVQLKQSNESSIDNNKDSDSSADDTDSDPNANDDDHDETKEYEFSVMSQSKPGEVMQKGDLVEFQLAKSKVTNKVIAVNVRSVRERKTATIDTVKGQVAYLNFEIDGGKKVSFHLTEYTNKTGTALSPGDLVEFDLIRGRNHKFSAANVNRIKEKEATPRPAALVNRIKAMTINDDGPKVIAIRQPRGPDGTRGFSAAALTTACVA